MDSLFSNIGELFKGENKEFFTWLAIAGALPPIQLAIRLSYLMQTARTCLKSV